MRVNWTVSGCHGNGVAWYQKSGNGSLWNVILDIRTQYQSKRTYSFLVLFVQNFSQSWFFLGYHSNHDDKNVIFQILVQWALQWYMVIMGFNEWMIQKNELQNRPNPRLTVPLKFCCVLWPFFFYWGSLQVCSFLSTPLKTILALHWLSGIGTENEACTGETSLDECKPGTY